ncbi:odorant receptor 30a-like isoform X2 [Cylas formicarius]|uniref:odorant receptor 30a-like isoform X2 n=1 Tax=Cylas formicarius TaxID=197179 RepID=UPI002958A7BF|nr:odorant receptor 30a-like isoform X2 [Cylas formicarius]
MADAGEIMKMSKYGMIASGLWRLPLNQPTVVKKMYVLYSVYVHVVFTLFLLLIMIQFIILCTKNDLSKELSDQRFTVFSYFISTLTTQVKLLIFQSNNVWLIISYIMDEEKKLLAQVNLDILSYHRRQVSFERWINTVIFSLSAFLGLATVVANGIQRHQIEKHNRFYNDSLPKPTLFPLYYCNIDTEKHNTMLAISNTMWVIIIIVISTPTQGFYLACITFASSMLKALQIRLSKTDEEKNLDETLEILIREHQRIIAFVKNLNETVKYLMMMDYLLNAVNIAGVVLILLEAADGIEVASALFYAGRLVVIVFALGWTSNEIRIQSQALADAIYETPWWEQQNKIQKVLHIMIMRGQCPLAITIGPFDDMTIQSSLTIMKAAYSYGTIMSQNYR